MRVDAISFLHLKVVLPMKKSVALKSGIHIVVFLSVKV
jgi:hypothetical protein